MTKTVLTTISYCTYNILIALVFAFIMFYILHSTKASTNTINRIPLIINEPDEFSKVKDNDFSRFFNQDMMYLKRNTDSAVVKQNIVNKKVDSTKINMNKYNKSTKAKF